MLPSSRTPEGEPLRCPICGAACNVDVSRPPGDSVCPCCGTHAWMAGDPEDIARTVAQIKTSIKTYTERLSVLCRTSASVESLAGFLVSGMTECLRAYGSMLWIAQKHRQRSRHTILDLAASDGETDSPKFAHEVVFANKRILRNVEIDGRKTLLIGVPVKRDDTVVGVIEVLQPSDVGPHTQMGYVRFVSYIAEILGGCASLVL